MIEKNTKIVCTIGPASHDKKILKRMIHAGMNVARLNFSHGTYEEFKKTIQNIKAASLETGEAVAIMQDLQGPKIRIGKMPEEGIELKTNATIILTTKNVIGTKNIIPVQYKNLPCDVRKNDIILIDDGQIEVSVIKTNGKNITVRVLVGGVVKTHKGINVPTGSISAHPLTSKDLRDLVFGIHEGVDFVALSFVRNAENIEELRKKIRKLKGKVHIIAKIERHEALEHLEEIIKASDAVMVARGDLGCEIPPEKVPIIQKKIIHVANRYGKPVITATEMLQSMIENHRATRAEVSDVANAVFDHTDAVMLSNESAVGKYPVEATETLAKVAHVTEQEMKKHPELTVREYKNKISSAEAICKEAADLAHTIGAKRIVAVTKTGFTAMNIARHRLFTPIIAITSTSDLKNKLQLVWGIQNTIIKNIKKYEEVKKLLLKLRLVKKNDKIVVVWQTAEKEKFIKTMSI